MSLTGVSYPGKGISYTPDPAFAANNPLKFRVAQVIQVSMISMIKPNGSNSILVIHGVNGEISTTAEALWAAGTAASYAAQSGQHVLLTDATTSKTFYLNADLFKGVSNVPGGVNSLLQYGTEGAQFKSVTVVGTAATIQAAFDAAASLPSGNILSVGLLGTTQGDAAPIAQVDGESSFVTLTGATTPATAAGAILAASTIKGTVVTLYNEGASFAALVYPSTGFNIDGLAANAAFTIPALSSVTLTLAGANLWLSSFVQSAQDVRAGGTGVTGDATVFLFSPDRLNLVHVTNASGASNGVRPIASNSDGGSLLFINQSSTLGGQVFPPTGQNFGLGADVPIMVPPLGSVLVAQTTSGNWRIVYGYNLAVQSGTASTTQTQAAGTLIHQSAVNMSTVANAGDAFTISRALRQFTATNATANAAQVFPPVGGTIDALGANASCTVYPGSTLVFTSNDGLAWKLSGTRSGTSVFNGAGGLFTVVDTNIRATSTVSVSTTSIAATTAVGFSTAITAATGFTTTNFDAAAAVVADTRTTAYVINY